MNSSENENIVSIISQQTQPQSRTNTFLKELRSMLKEIFCGCIYGLFFYFCTAVLW